MPLIAISVARRGNCASIVQLNYAQWFKCGQAPSRLVPTSSPPASLAQRLPTKTTRTTAIY